LLKTTVTGFDDALAPDVAATDYPLRATLGWNAHFVVKQTHPRTPDWVRHIAPLLDGDLGAIKTSSSGSLLLLKTGGRIFAFTFAYGKSLLKPDCFERDFGLRVVLNTVDPEFIRSVDMRTMEEITVLTRRQASRASDFSTFGLDSSQDLLRGVTGRPSDATFADRVSGAEALTFAADMEMSELPAKCALLLEAYSATRYKGRFSFIDYLRIERDTTVTDQLDQALVADLNAGNLTRMHLAPPEPEDWENITGFTYSNRQNAVVYPDLDVAQAIAEMNRGNAYSVQYLSTKSIGVRFREAAESTEKYSVYSCLVYETELAGKLYVLSGGDWHQVAKNWADDVRSRVRAIPGSSVALPASKAGEIEELYNKRVAAASNWALMDRRIVSLAPPHDRVEMCDLLTPTKQLIHVKRKTVSATLSHLFAQGAVSADLFSKDDEFREKCREQAAVGNAAWVPMIPLARPNTSEYEIVYAILARTTPNWPAAMPFFSQLNLDRTATRLRQLGYKVALQHVPADP
jgi:uncharacterized protein (TIGR04141 family)